MKDVTYVKAKQIEEQNLADEAMLYDTNTDYIHVLNPAAQEIWKMLDGKHSRDDIVKHFIQNYSQEDEKKLKKDIEEAISNMLEKGVIIENT